MAELKVTTTSSRMLLSDQMWMFYKGIEHFYYFLLFNSKGSYASNPETWRSWVQMGFHLALKDAPPETADGDVLRMDMRPGKTFEVTAYRADGAVLEKVYELLLDVESLRTSVQGKSDEERGELLTENPKIRAKLVEPLWDSIKRAKLPDTDTIELNKAVQRALGGLTDNEITKVEIEFSKTKVSAPA